MVFGPLAEEIGTWHGPSAGETEELPRPHPQAESMPPISMEHKRPEEQRAHYHVNVEASSTDAKQRRKQKENNKTTKHNKRQADEITYRRKSYVL